METVSDVAAIRIATLKKLLISTLVIIRDMIMFDTHYPVVTSAIDPGYFIA